MEKKNLPTRYLPFSISHYSPTELQSRIHRPKNKNTFFIYLLFHSCWIQDKIPNPTGSTTTILLFSLINTIIQVICSGYFVD